MRLASLALLTMLPVLAAGKDKWNIAYLHDEDQSSLLLRAIEFPSDQRGIAIGILTEKGRPRSIALVTADGGKTWDQIKLKEEPLSLACFTDAVCWISSPKGVWRSEEGGRQWTKISDTKGIFKMYFTSATEGLAAGARKSAWETKDSGKTWTLLPALKDLSANPDNAQFMAIAMIGSYGIIGGNSRPPRKDDSIYPDWMIPEEASKRREYPGVMIMLETRDAGKTWTPSSNAVFGTLTALRMQPEGGLAGALLEYFHSFEAPSEVLLIDLKSGRSRSIFRDKTAAITDLHLGVNGAILIGGVDGGAIRSLPIPQRVRFHETAYVNGSPTVVWTALDVDYRATARRVILARKPSGEYWAVTDTGIILRLDREVKPAP